MKAVSLFSNCGAGDFGFRSAGFTFEVMAELDERRLEVCLLNHPGAQGVPGDLRKTWEYVVVDYHLRRNAEGVPLKNRPPTLLAACPPCQGMSSARSGLGKGDDPDAGSKDKRNLLVMVVADVARALRPKFLVVENVPQFLTRKVRHPHTEEAVSASRLLVDELEESYRVFPILTDLADYGVPQTRRRSFLTFVRNDLSEVLGVLDGHGRAPYPKPTHTSDYEGEKPVTLRRELERLALPSLDAQDESKAKAEGYDGLHEVPVWRDRRYPMVAAIPPYSGKSAWENDACERCGTVSVGPEDVTCPKCGAPLLRPVVVETDGTVRFVRGFRTSSYRRMPPDDPTATITTASGHVGSDLTIHPWENRLLSTLECARLQTIPEEFEWGCARALWGHTNVREMIGEAVPPRFTEKHGRVLASLLDGTCDPNLLLPRSDVRCARAAKKLKLPERTLFSSAESS